ncbi:hemicentin-1-like [Lingula anatina]|uniref:Hemicentin-1-like n=1 Tax=Lingula anatina TaxID=7574 RepID=A0A1S3JD22_LINAN|nr:hemicentin-1-like [Lingula anatina]|eukprot:XP_013408315.1 hemicentin-1-like [Lingula anatina]
MAATLYVQAAPCNFQWQAPERQYANEGGQFTVDCSFTANYQPSNYLYVIAWRNPLGLALELVLHNDNIIDDATLDQWNRQYTFIKPATVQLSAATAADAGNYTCRVRLILGCDSTSIPDKQIQIVLRVPPSKSVITRYQSTGFTVSEGDYPRLKCMSATGTPPLVYTWGRGSTSLTGTPDSANTFSILTIPSIQRSQQGPYQCSVQNAAGANTSDSVTLDVQYPPGRATVDGGQSSTTVTAVEGQPHTLNCEFTDKGNPQATSFDWYVHSSTDSSRQAASYWISQTALTDSGTYHCRPSNAIGRAPSTIQSNPQNLTVNESDVSVQLTCVARGKPVPTVTWTRGNQDVNSQLYTVQDTPQLNGVTQYDTVTSTLTLAGPGRTGDKVTRTDHGYYSCTASNGVGAVAKSSFYINVQYRAELHPTKVSVREVAADIGSVGLFTLYVVGNPKPTSSTWMRVNGSLPANAVPGHDIDNQISTLTIPHLGGEDFGTYTCVVKNAAGERGFTFILEMRGKPDPPTDISALKVSAVSVTVQWTSNKNGGYEQTFTIQYKAPGEDWQSITNIEDPGYKRRRSYKVQNLQADTQYRFRVESRNKDGSGGYSYELVVQTKLDVKRNIATIKWSLPEGEFAGYGIQYCVQGTNQCASHNITNVTVTSANITLPDDGHQYEFSLIVYQGDDAVVSSLLIKQEAQTAQGSFPVGVGVGVITAVVLVAVTGVFVFLYFSRRNRNHNNANRNDGMGRENVTNELSVIQSREENNLYEKPYQAEETQPAYAVLKY